MAKWLLTCAAVLVTLGVLAPVMADPSLRAEAVSNGLLRENPGRHLALGHFKQNASLAIPGKASDSTFSMAAGLSTRNLHIHGYREPTNVQTVANPEPATMILLGSGLIGIAAAIRKRRSASRG